MNLNEECNGHLFSLAVTKATLLFRDVLFIPSPHNSLCLSLAIANSQVILVEILVNDPRTDVTSNFSKAFKYVTCKE